MGEIQREVFKPSKLVSIIGYKSLLGENLTNAPLCACNSILLFKIRPVSQIPGGIITFPPPFLETALIDRQKLWYIKLNRRLLRKINNIYSIVWNYRFIYFIHFKFNSTINIFR